MPKIAKSPKARNKIKRALKAKKFKYSESGKEIIKHKLGQLKIEFSEDTIRKLIKYFNIKTPVELFQQFAENKIDSLKIAKVFTKQEIKPEPELKNINENITDRKTEPSEDFLIIDNNLSTLDYQFAKCCNPIPGDNIFGFIII